MPTPVTAIRNIGPAMAKTLARAGIETAEELRALGAETAYSRLLASGHRAHFIAFYALAMGLQGRPWNDCAGAEKDALRIRFDAMKAQAITAAPKDKGSARMDAALAEIGVIERSRR